MLSSLNKLIVQTASTIMQSDFILRWQYICFFAGLKEKVLLHTATYRMMLGANPSKTHMLLKRTSVQHSEQKVSISTQDV